MDLRVVVETPDRYAAWIAEQKSAARSPRTQAEQSGLHVFLGASCPLCHSIQGTPARGLVGPDLTHLGARATIAAGAAPRNAESLAKWIRAPNHLKPGAYMPPGQLAEPALSDLVSYLGSLE